MHIKEQLDELLEDFLDFFRKKQIYEQEDDKSPLRIGKRNFIFIHINKNAGTSICERVGIKNIQHYTAKRCIDLIGKSAWDEAFKFTVVRNPWDKVVSQYKYRIKVNKNDMGTGNFSFEDWIMAVYGENPDPNYHDEPEMFMTQLNWLRNHDNIVDIDYVARFENLRKDFKTIARKLGVSSKLPSLNQTEKVNYRDYYNEKTQAIVREKFKEDIEYFKFEF